MGFAAFPAFFDGKPLRLKKKNRTCRFIE